MAYKATCDLASAFLIFFFPNHTLAPKSRDCSFFSSGSQPGNGTSLPDGVVRYAFVNGKKHF